MGRFERYLSVWVAMGMAAGVALGLGWPQAFQAVAALEWAHVNLVVAVCIWVMVYPMMVQIDWPAVTRVHHEPRGLLLTVAVNWLVKPFSMAALGVVFFHHLYAPWLSPEQADAYLAGVILLGVAPCTAMVFVWSQLVRGDPNYTLVQVSLNDAIMVVAFAPIAAGLLGMTSLSVPWSTLWLSTALYVVLPLGAGVLTRHLLQRRGGPAAVNAWVGAIKPWSSAGLVVTVVLLFGLQAPSLVAQPVVIALIAVPLVVQSYGIFFLTWWGARRLRLAPAVAGPACLIGTSNFFELAVAVAVSLFGLNSGAALATVVGVLVEVPVMLSLVAWLNRRQA